MTLGCKCIIHIVYDNKCRVCDNKAELSEYSWEYYYVGEVLNRPTAKQNITCKRCLELLPLLEIKNINL